MGYNGIKLHETLSIRKIFSIHYFEYMSDFFFPGESHNFWEFVYVDKGEVIITRNQQSQVLKKGELLFHSPNEFHGLKIAPGTTSNLIVISFDCRQPTADFFSTVLEVDQIGQNLLANIIIEARHCFDCPLDDPYLQNMPLKETPAFACEQLLKLYLEHFLLHLIRRYSYPVLIHQTTTSHLYKPDRKGDSQIFNRIVSYLEAKLTEPITISQICHDNLIGRSKLQKLFKDHTNLGIIEFYSHLKMDAAKELIRKNNMTFTQIADHLGFSSIHYFSRQFKKITGMAPSEYLSSVKAIAELPASYHQD